MSQIRPSLLLVAVASMFCLAGCGDKNDKVVFSPESGHSSDWMTTHKTSAKADLASCKECHGGALDGGVSRVSCTSQSAVAGFRCHVTSPALSMTGCVSCHGGPTNGPFGDVKPNRKSAHSKHTALPGVDCDTCHLNAGTGTVSHARADGSGNLSNGTVAIAAKYNANKASVPFGYNADGKCSNVSCHGGTLTRAWTDTLVVTSGQNTICLACHEQRSSSGIQQYNSYYSGDYSGTNLHEYHLGVAVNANCTDCHKIGTLTNYQQHYGGITANVFTSPLQTIGGSSTKIGSYTSGTCLNTVGCHSAGFDPVWQ